MPLEVTKATVSGRTGGNGAPASGWATFSDGKTYFYGPRIERDETDGAYRTAGFSFSATRKMPSGEHQNVSFRSPKREEALRSFLDAGKGDARVFQVRMGG